jgi:hypothetical protein
VSGIASYLLLTLALLGYGVSTGSDALTVDAVTNVPIGTAVRLADISPFNAEAVCILVPYQDRLASKYAFAARVNDHLAEKGFRADEGHFALVFIGGRSIEVATLSRRRIDMLPMHMISPQAAQMLPEGFTPQSCASGEVAALAKIEFRDRTYIVLGVVN